MKTTQNETIVFNIIKNSAKKNETRITNKEIINIAEKLYGKKLYDKTITKALDKLQSQGFIRKYIVYNTGIVNGRNIVTRTRVINVENDPSKNINKKITIYNIVNDLQKNECLTIREITEIYCKNILTDENIEYIMASTKKTKEEVIDSIINKNKGTVSKILTELAEEKKIIEHRAIANPPRNMNKQIKEKIKELPKNTLYYTPKKK
jgi:hypothetical protein